MAIYAIGDIHGCLNALKKIFKQKLITPKDKVIFLGDYIDKGPNSKGVIDFLIKYKKKYDFEFILGNHDIAMIDARKSEKKFKDWVDFGGDTTLESYGIKNFENWDNQISDSHWDFLNSCQRYIEIGKVIYVHAGLEIGKTLAKQDDYHLLWKKYKHPECYDPNRLVICGHTSRKSGEIANFDHTICIDTYCYGGQWLTCLNVETKNYLKTNNSGEVSEGKVD